MIYVAGNGSCTAEIPTRADLHRARSSCGNAYVSGTYAKPLTIAAANDIIVKPTSSAVAGGRQHHPARAPSRRSA